MYSEKLQARQRDSATFAGFADGERVLESLEGENDPSDSPQENRSPQPTQMSVLPETRAGGGGRWKQMLPQGLQRGCTPLTLDFGPVRPTAEKLGTRCISSHGPVE